CQELLQLYEEIDKGTGRGTSGLPPLSDPQQQLFHEDVFEAFLLAAQVNWDVNFERGKEAQDQAARQAIDWLDPAGKQGPKTKALYVRRMAFWEKLGDQKKAHADNEQAAATKPTSAVDHFWHAIAENLRAEEAKRKGDPKKEQEHYRKAIGEFAAVLRIRP